MHTFSIENKEYSVDSKYFYENILCGIEVVRAEKILAKAIDDNIPITTEIVKKLYDAEHEGKVNKFIKNYNIRGIYKYISLNVDEEIKTDLIDKFKNDPRFHGRVPQIIESIALVANFYLENELKRNREKQTGCNKAEIMEHINSTLVEKFNINAVRTMLQKNIPQCMAVMFYNTFSVDKCQQIAENIEPATNIYNLLLKAENDDNTAYIDAAAWISEHLSTNQDTMKKIIKNADRLELSEQESIGGIEAKLSSLKSLKEVKKIEKQYKKTGFKFKKCKCELKDCGHVISNNDYKAYIMLPTDERQVRLGYDTTCCQKLYDIGESAMMHGLLNPKAGFWVIEDKNSGQIKAQAEVWEDNDHTLVFDNIEFANDADIDLYKNIIGKWLNETEYADVIMGRGYNVMFSNHSKEFLQAPPCKPSVTPYEVYVISHEEESEAPIFDSEEEAKRALDNREVTYYDYVYCDSENESLWMKKDNVLEPYFLNDELLKQYANIIFSDTSEITKQYQIRLQNLDIKLLERISEYFDHNYPKRDSILRELGINLPNYNPMDPQPDPEEYDDEYEDNEEEEYEEDPFI